jgi:hypothetical protein
VRRLDRYTQHAPKKELAKGFDYDGLFDLAPRYTVQSR